MKQISVRDSVWNFIHYYIRHSVSNFCDKAIANKVDVNLFYSSHIYFYLKMSSANGMQLPLHQAIVL